MYTQISSKLFVAQGTTEVSQAIPMEGYNTARVEFTVFAGSVLTVDIEESNDLENWTGLHSVGTGWLAPNYAIPVGSKCDAAYIRVKWECDMDSVIAAGVNLSNQ